jgi:hypothetical protein
MKWKEWEKCEKKWNDYESTYKTKWLRKNQSFNEWLIVELKRQ